MTSSEPPAPIKSSILIVANPTSRGGKASQRFETVEEYFHEFGLSYEFRYTLPEGKTADMVSRAVADEGYRTVVYMGGDGTFNEVAKGVCGSGVPRDVRIGMLPSGTANDQGNSFGIKSKGKALRRNVEVIAEGFTTDLDVGEIKTYSVSDVITRRDLFFDSAGWGLSAAILSFRNQELSNVKDVPVVRDMYRDHMVYVRAAAHKFTQAWMTQDKFDVILTLDGERHHLTGLTDLVVSNTPVYAGEWVVDSDAAHDDGLFEVQPFCGVRDWASKLILNHKKVDIPENVVSQLNIPSVPPFKASSFSGQFIPKKKKKKLLAQLDGEEFLPSDRFEVKVHKRMLRLIVPEDHHWI